MMPRQPKAYVVVFPGSNGDRDLFEALERAGFSAHYHPSDAPLPSDCALAGLPGGFSYGDYWRAGMLASQAKAVQSLPELVAKGGLVIGICNGFQILVESGLLPGALSYNNPPGFRHGWCALEVQAVDREFGQSPWLAHIPKGTVLRMPYAHGEGQYFHPDGEAGVASRVALKYIQNPNGSLADTAALLDATGLVLGIMPHPERASEPDLGCSDGLSLFASAFRHLQEAT